MASSLVVVNTDDWHYYECHVTFEYFYDPSRLETLESIAKVWGFRFADLYYVKDDSPSRKDLFCSARERDYGMLENSMVNFIGHAKGAGFGVIRYKIESTLLDSRHDDIWDFLSDDSR